VIEQSWFGASTAQSDPGREIRRAADINPRIKRRLFITKPPGRHEGYVVRV